MSKENGVSENEAIPKNYKNRIPMMKVSLSGTMRDGMSAIVDGELGVAIVVDGDTDRFIGLITDGDIRRAQLSSKDHDAPIGDIVNRNVVTVMHGASSKQIAALFSSVIRVIPILNDLGQVSDLALFDNRMHLPVAEPYLAGRELNYVIDCITSGWVSSAGKYIGEFEQLVSEACHAKYGVSATNGTSALHLALLACGIGPGDEVIVPALTFIAPASTVCHVGAKPVFVDVDRSSWCLDPEQLENLISPTTKAVIPVHLYGHPAEMDAILDIAKKYKLWVIEDAAEALGAEFKSKPVGSYGHVAVFSFYGNKTITTGEGGMAVTSDRKLAEKMKLLRDHGMDNNQRYRHSVLGFNYRMTNLQAAVGVGQMENFEEILQKKIDVAERYSKLLSEVVEITLPSEVRDGKHSYWMYTVIINREKTNRSRDQILSELGKQNIEVMPTFIPMNRQPVFSESKEYPVSEYVGTNGLCLPSFVSLTNSEIVRVADTLASVVRD